MKECMCRSTLPTSLRIFRECTMLEIYGDVRVELAQTVCYRVQEQVDVRIGVCGSQNIDQE